MSPWLKILVYFCSINIYEVSTHVGVRVQWWILSCSWPQIPSRLVWRLAQESNSGGCTGTVGRGGGVGAKEGRLVQTHQNFPNEVTGCTYGHRIPSRCLDGFIHSLTLNDIYSNTWKCLLYMPTAEKDNSVNSLLKTTLLCHGEKLWWPCAPWHTLLWWSGQPFGIFKTMIITSVS